MTKVASDSEWFKRRWLEFRQGYGTYLTFFFGVSNFILLVYNFVPEIKQGVNFNLFTIIFAIIIVPLAVYIGHLHYKKQFPTESKVSAHLNPYKDVIQPESKEELSTKYSIFSLKLGVFNQEFNIWSYELANWHMRNSNWNFRYNSWSLRNQQWNMRLTLLNMRMMNFLLEDAKAPKELRYDRQIGELDRWIKDSEKWLEDLEGWKLQQDKLIIEQTQWKEEAKKYVDDLRAWTIIYEKLYQGEKASKLVEETKE